MRKNLVYLLMILVLLLVSKACEKNETPIEDLISLIDIDAVKATLTAGDWKIVHFFDSQIDQTSGFEGYILNFNSDGILGATNGNSSLSGAWTIASSANSDENSGGIDFEILFSTPELFEQLSDCWAIKNFNDSKIELMNNNGENGGTNLLTFEKL